MLGKIAQLRHRLASAVTSLESQRPLPPSDPQLPRKLQFLLEHILKQPQQAQFKAYHELQSPDYQLNELLAQIHHAQPDLDQLTAILHFYTFLLLNCKNELVLCKLVSAPLVLALTRFPTPQQPHMQDLDSYRIALLRAYVQRLDSETVKYMMVGDRLPVFQHCVEGYLGMSAQSEEECGVEATCLANVLLVLVHFAAKQPEYAPALCHAPHGLQQLILAVGQRIHNALSELLKAQWSTSQLQSVEGSILFLVDLVSSVTEEDYRRELVGSSRKQLPDWRKLFQEVVDSELAPSIEKKDEKEERGQEEREERQEEREEIKIQEKVRESKELERYASTLELTQVMLRLLTVYYNQEELAPIVQQHLLPILDRFLQHLQSPLQQSPTSTQANIFCANIEIVAVLLESGGHFARRSNWTETEGCLRAAVTNRLIDILDVVLGGALLEALCLKSVKLLLLSLMHLTLQSQHQLQGYSVLKLHLATIQRVKLLLKHSQLWDYLVLHYQPLVRSISSHLLSVAPQAQEYSYCQYHSLRTASPEEALHNAIGINECVRNFRFMIVEATQVSQKDIKLEKTYHTNFISPGWHCEPGQLTPQHLPPIAHLQLLMNGHRLPVVVLEDEECLLLAVEEDSEQQRVVANIRYKSVEGFAVEKEAVRIHLKGAQEVVVEPPKTDRDTSKFRQYLIEKRDRSRQRELRFIHHYLDIYEHDNRQIIATLQQQDIADPPQPPQPQEEPDTRAEIKEESQDIKICGGEGGEAAKSGGGEEEGLL